jgi:uncharacterized RDD family membrane protein YckC
MAHQQQPYGASYGQPVAPTYELSGWGRRFGAAFVDGIIVQIVSSIIAAAVGLSVFSSSSEIDAGNEVSVFMIYLAVSTVLVVGVMGYTGGQSIGKMAMDIRVVREDGRPMDYSFAFVREFLVKNVLMTLIAVFTLGIGWLINYLWPLWDDQNRAGHDRIVKSRVVRGSSRSQQPQFASHAPPQAGHPGWSSGAPTGAPGQPPPDPFAPPQQQPAVPPQPDPLGPPTGAPPAWPTQPPSNQPAAPPPGPPSGLPQQPWQPPAPQPPVGPPAPPQPAPPPAAPAPPPQPPAAPQQSPQPPPVEQPPQQPASPQQPPAPPNQEQARPYEPPPGFVNPVDGE